MPMTPYAPSASSTDPATGSTWSCIPNTRNGYGYPNINRWCNDANLTRFCRRPNRLWVPTKRFSQKSAIVFYATSTCGWIDGVCKCVSGHRRQNESERHSQQLCENYVLFCSYTLFAPFDISHWMQCKWDNNTYSEHKRNTHKLNGITKILNTKSVAHWRRLRLYG